MAASESTRYKEKVCDDGGIDGRWRLQYSVRIFKGEFGWVQSKEAVTTRIHECTTAEEWS